MQTVSLQLEVESGDRLPDIVSTLPARSLALTRPKDFGDRHATFRLQRFALR